MVHYAFIFYLIGWVIVLIALTMLVPAIVDFSLGYNDAPMFFLIAFLLFFLGVLAIIANRNVQNFEPSTRDVFMLTILAWITAILTAMIPLHFGPMHLGWVDSLFQSSSLITTTGANVMVGIDYAPPGFLIWCSLLQWIGGQGIVLMALTVMPLLPIGGMQLFYSESLDLKEKMLPRLRQTLATFFLVYFFLTVICSVALWGAGLGVVDAICHGMTTIATGGFSTWDKSIQAVDSLPIQMILTVFMILGGSTFLLLTKMWTFKSLTFFRDQQVRLYFLLIGSISFLIGIWHTLRSSDQWYVALVESFFNVTSALTTTGYVSADYDEWGSLSLVVFFFLPFIGGCTGSTTGGIKLFRWRILCSLALIQLKRLRHPHGIFTPTYNGKTIENSVIHSIVGFFVLFMMTYAVFAIILSCFELDFLTSLFAAMAAITNLGPGLGEMVGPSETYSNLPQGAKVFLSMAMLIGRLEVMTFYIILLPSFWKN